MSQFEKILFGVVLFTSANLFGDSGFIPKIVAKPVALVGLIMVIYYFIHIKKQFPFKGVEKWAYTIYLVYALWVAIWGITNAVGITFADFLLTNRIWWFFTPLFVLLPFCEKNLALIFKWAFIQTCIALLFIVINWDNIADIFNAVVPFSLMFPMMAFICYVFKLKRKYTFVILITYLISLYAPMIAGRRTAVLLLLFFPLAYMFAKYVKLKSLFYVIPLLMLYVVFGEIFFNWVLSYFPIMSERMFVDNRSSLNEVFLAQFSTNELIFGRGLTGTYIATDELDFENPIRTLIENAYLNVILKGGLLLLVPYVFLLIKTIVRCFRDSKNIFGVYSIVYIAGILLSMASLMPTLSLGTLILWFMIKGNCYNSFLHHPTFGNIILMPSFTKYTNLKFIHRYRRVVQLKKTNHED